MWHNMLILDSHFLSLLIFYKIIKVIASVFI